MAEVSSGSNTFEHVPALVTVTVPLELTVTVAAVPPRAVATRPIVALRLEFTLLAESTSDPAPSDQDAAAGREVHGEAGGRHRVDPARCRRGLLDSVRTLLYQVDREGNRSGPGCGDGRDFGVARIVQPEGPPPLVSGRIGDLLHRHIG